MPNFKLSRRMAAVADLVPAGVTACDVGCDHGFVAIHLVEKGICPRVIATDINRGPLSRAREHIESVSLSTYIETRLSDGLELFQAGEAECVIAAGMGGRLVVKILSDFPEKVKSLRYLVLQPQSELHCVRRFLREQGFVIRREDMVLEEGKFYPMMLAEKDFGDETGCSAEGGAGSAAGLQDGGQSGFRLGKNAGQAGEAASARNAYVRSLEDEFGPCLIKDRHPVLLRYLDWWEDQQQKILKQVLIYPERRAQVAEELARIRDVRELMRERRAAASEIASGGKEKLPGQTSEERSS